MKKVLPPAKKAQAKRTGVISAALSWDGGRFPTRTLPPKARAFLADGDFPSRRVLAEWAAAGDIREIRICWVPRLQGGDDVLADPFVTQLGMRLPFRAVRSARFGDVLGVVYCRQDFGSLRSSGRGGSRHLLDR